MNQDLICVLGPTASGKTKYAVKLALELGGEIISADSRQVYKGMDIGTGKDLDEYRVGNIQIPYHLIDIVDAGEKYNLFQYQKDFEKAYNDIKSRGKTPILCGGSGLYIDAVTRGYSLAEVPENSMLREELEADTMDDLVLRLQSLKQPHNKSDFDSKKRIIRAIEIAIFYQNNDVSYSKSSGLDTKFIGILVSKEQRNQRIDRRLEERLNSGMIREVENLISLGVKPETLIYYGLEYKYITMYLLKLITYSQMEQQLAIAIHQFAKRQMTWYRGMERRGVNIEWV